VGEGRGFESWLTDPENTVHVQKLVQDRWVKECVEGAGE